MNKKTVFDDFTLEFVSKSLLAGGIAGMCSKTTVAPLDRMKILMQAHSSHYKNINIINGIVNIVKREGFSALYKGNGAQMIRIFPYAATQFTSFEVYFKIFTSIIGLNSHAGRFLSGSGAGVTAVTVTYPLDIVRARLAFQVSGHQVYSGVFHVLKSMVENEGGVKALYRGYVPTICGMIPYAGFAFYTFETLKYSCMKYLPEYTCESCADNTGGMALVVPAKLMCGAGSGALAQTVSYPFDVTRRRMQLSMMSKETQKYSSGMIQTMRLVYQEHGIVRGLYRGMSINYVRAVPMVSVSFSVYELMKQLLHMDTGLKISVG